MLEVEGLTFRHKGQPQEILRDVSFRVRKGEITVLLGPNGSGKSTLFRCLVGIWKPQKGTIKIDGKSVNSLTYKERAKRISYVPQDHEPSFPYKVLEIVLMGRVSHLGVFSTPGDKDLLIAKRALEMLGIGHLGEKTYTKVSGGERQLTLLARAIAQGASYVLLDEPTSHLDFKNQWTVLSKIREFSHNEGKGVLISLHDPNLALFFGDWVLVLNKGEIVVQGAPSEVITEDLIEEVYGIKVYSIKTNGFSVIVPYVL
ncbi:MAG: ABC transporter ATP-binding protein [Candidatus Bathyarchaeia archaeon]